MQPGDEPNGPLVGRHEAARMARHVVEAERDLLSLLRRHRGAREHQQESQDEVPEHDRDAHAAPAPGISLALAQ